MGSTDEIPVTFKDAASAVAWAGNTLGRPILGSQIGRMMRGIGSDVSPDELRDVAMTIIAAAMRTEPRPMSLIYIYVHGAANPQVLRDAIPMLLKFVKDTVPEAKNRNDDQLRRLATLTVIAERMRNRSKRLSVEDMAKHVGISRRGFNKAGWPELRAGCMRVVREWLDLADRRLFVVLDEKGLIARD